jgi:predicted transposase YdaD
MEEPDMAEYRSEYFRNIDAKGRAAGRAEGRAEGRGEGLVEGLAQAILSVLATRWLEASAEVVAEVRRCRDRALLERWLERAVRVRSAAELLDRCSSRRRRRRPLGTGRGRAAS